MKEVWNGMKSMTGCSMPAFGVRDRICELNLFFNRFDTTPTPVRYNCLSGSPPIISIPIHSFVRDSAVCLSIENIRKMATPPSVRYPQWNSCDLMVGVVAAIESTV